MDSRVVKGGRGCGCMRGHKLCPSVDACKLVYVHEYIFHIHIVNLQVNSQQPTNAYMLENR